MTTENPTANDLQNNTKTNEPEVSKTSASMVKTATRVAIKNVTDKIHVSRGSIRSFNVGASSYYVEPGDVVSVPEDYYNKIRNNKDSHGQKIWEKVDLSELNSRGNNRRRSYLINDEQDGGSSVENSPKLDNDFVEMFSTLISDKESELTAISTISTCESEPTLNHIMKITVGNTRIDSKLRNKIVDEIVKQINELKVK